jgi:DNA replicative helicase MCM subunit Mcm2 (Cdc46/Mcm family)
VDNLYQNFDQQLNKLSLNNIKSTEKKLSLILKIKSTFAFANLSLVPIVSKTDIIDAINLSGKVLK